MCSYYHYEKKKPVNKRKTRRGWIALPGGINGNHPGRKQNLKVPEARR
jgi:hypothetical protein